MKPKELWVAAYRFVRSMDAVQINGRPRQAINGLYPSWMENGEYRRFLAMCNDVRSCRGPRDDKLADNEYYSKKISEVQERLTWCEQTTVEDVRRHIRDIIKDRLNVW